VHVMKGNDERGLISKEKTSKKERSRQAFLAKKGKTPPLGRKFLSKKSVILVCVVKKGERRKKKIRGGGGGRIIRAALKKKKKEGEKGKLGQGGKKGASRQFTEEKKKDREGNS